jgi:AbrB family looped-hinge helix DNA binding protein
MAAIRAKVLDGGRIVVPAKLRKPLGLQKGDTVFLELDGDEIRISTAKAALRRLQAMVKQHAPEGFDLVESLIADRRAEADRG